MMDVSLLETDVRKMDFLDDLKWPVQLRDEREAESATDRAEVARLYRRLRHNLEENRNFPDAGRFYYGEMQIRRKHYWWRQYLPSMTTLYWLSCGYGQGPLLAFVNTLGLVALAAAGFMLAGLRLDAAYLPATGANPFHGPPRIDWLWVVPHGLDFSALGEWCRHFCYAALHVFEVATLSRIRHYTYLSGWGDSLGVLITVLIPLQATLFVLAVRRRFKR